MDMDGVVLMSLRIFLFEVLHREGHNIQLRCEQER
jgi:hypothetical protein